MSADGSAVRLTVLDTAAMEALGARVATLLRAGDVVLLDGELGAGKTTFTRGLGAALRVRGAVTSPTFVLARTHPTASGVPLVHVDAYRLASAVELDDLDIDFPGSITVIEWGAGKTDGITDSWLQLAIERRRGGDPDALTDDAVEEPRTVTFRAVGPRWAGLDASALEA